MNVYLNLFLLWGFLLKFSHTHLLEENLTHRLFRHIFLKRCAEGNLQQIRQPSSLAISPPRNVQPGQETARAEGGRHPGNPRGSRHRAADGRTLTMADLRGLTGNFQYEILGKDKVPAEIKGNEQIRKSYLGY